MTLDELRTEFPGLFKPMCCLTLAEAERHADTVSASMGLGMRVAQGTKEGGLRTIEYRDRFGAIAFRVVIERHREGHTQPCWLFRCVAERTDLGLKIESGRTPYANPVAFEKEAKEMVYGMRRLMAGRSGRLTGSLMKWDAASGTGWLECVPGARVRVNLEDVPFPERPYLKRLSRFTFELRKSADGEPRAVNVHRKLAGGRSA